jgi:hypothetical protein
MGAAVLTGRRRAAVVCGGGASGVTCKWGSPMVLRLRSLTLDWREEREVGLGTAKRRESRAVALTKWSSLPRLRKTTGFVELGTGMNKRLPERDLAAACAELPVARATCAGEQQSGGLSSGGFSGRRSA